MKGHPTPMDAPSSSPHAKHFLDAVGSTVFLIDPLGNLCEIDFDDALTDLEVREKNFNAVGETATRDVADLTLATRAASMNPEGIVFSSDTGA